MSYPSAARLLLAMSLALASSRSALADDACADLPALLDEVDEPRPGHPEKLKELLAKRLTPACRAQLAAERQKLSFAQSERRERVMRGFLTALTLGVGALQFGLTWHFRDGDAGQALAALGGGLSGAAAGAGASLMCGSRSAGCLATLIPIGSVAGTAGGYFASTTSAGRLVTAGLTSALNTGVGLVLTWAL
jgi:hypothetical protein